MPIDVLIPAVEKDLGTLPAVIDSVRRYVRHPIGDVLVVAPASERIRRLCARKGARYVAETSVLPIGKRGIRYRSRTWDRSGWLYQQLLKLSGDRVARRDFLVIDADTVLIRPHRFRSGGKTVFYTRGWTQPEYYRAFSRLLGRQPSAPRSLVTHYMLFERKKLSRLKQAIEARHGKRWYRAILACVNRSQPFGFSEYETYGNYVYSLAPGRYVLKPALNRSLRAGPSRLSASRLRALARKHRSLSFHKRGVYRRKP